MMISEWMPWGDKNNNKTCVNIELWLQDFIERALFAPVFVSALKIKGVPVATTTIPTFFFIIFSKGFFLVPVIYIVFIV